MVKKKNYFIIISIVFFLITLITGTLFFSQQTIFGEEKQTIPVIPHKTLYTENEELRLSLSNPRFISGNCAAGSVVASAIWIDGKKYSCNEWTKRSSLHGELIAAFVCNTKDIPGQFSREGNPIRITQHNPLWGFNYGTTEIPKELVPGEHLVEGYALAFQGSSTFCPVDGVSEVGFFRFKINVKANPCTLNPNEMIVFESFANDFSKSDLTFNDDFVKFCFEHSPIRVREFFRLSYTDPDIITKLQNNQIVNLADDEVLGLFYVIKKPDSIQQFCKGEAFDIDKNQCTTISGFITACRDGFFDPATGTCLVTPEIKYICPKGGRFDSTQGLCIIQSEIKCEQGEYNKELDVCIYTPTLEGVCVDGSFDKDKNACIVELRDIDYLCLTGELGEDIDGNKICTITPETRIICKQGFTYDEESNKCELIGKLRFNLFILLPLISLVIALLFLIIGLVKRRK